MILWEILAGRRLFANDTHGQTLMRVANGRIDSPRSVRREVSPEMEAITMKALARQPKSRFRSARELAMALEAACPPAPQRVVGSEPAYRVSTAEAGQLKDRSALRCSIAS